MPNARFVLDKLRAFKLGLFRARFPVSVEVGYVLYLRSAYFSISGCSGAITINVTPNRVSGRVV